MTYRGGRPVEKPEKEVRSARWVGVANDLASAEYSEPYRTGPARGRRRTFADETRSAAHDGSRDAGKQRRGSPWPGRAVWLATGLGLFLGGLAVAISPHDYNLGLWLFWPSVAIPFVVFATVLMTGRPSAALQQVTVAMIGMYPAVLYRLASPFVLGGFDEHLHQRTLEDLLHGSSLFAPNPMLPVSPDYPGMELFTGVLVRLTGSPAVLGISIVVLLCRLLLVLTLYHATLTVTPSRRVASLVVLFYAISPQFFFFNSQFAYQTMALTLGIGGLFLLRRAQLARGAGTQRLTVLAIIALIATVVTHHITSWFVLGFLLAWAAVTSSGTAPAARRRRRDVRRYRHLDH